MADHLPDNRQALPGLLDLARPKAGAQRQVVEPEPFRYTTNLSRFAVECGVPLLQWLARFHGT